MRRLAIACVLLVLAASPAAAAAPRAPQRRPRRPPGRRVAGDRGDRARRRGRRSTRSRARYNLTITQVPAERRGAAGERRPARGAAAGRRGRSPVGRHPDPVVGRRRDATPRASAPTRCGRASDDAAAAVGAQGVTVAVIDSGIDPRHNALERPRAGRRWTSPAATASTASATGRTWRRSSPGQAGRTADTRDYRASRRARISSTCACSATTGRGRRATSSRRSTGRSIIAREYNIRVINLSLGAPVLQPYRDDPLCEAVERAVRAGHRRGRGGGQLRADDGRAVGVRRASRRRATARMRLTVGALDTHGTAQRSDDTVAAYSSSGPTRYDLVHEAGPGGAGQPHRVGGGGGVVSVDDISRRGTWRATGRTRTCSCRARAWRRRW